MSMTRRTLVRNLTALSALPLVSGLNRRTLAAVRRDSNPNCPSNAPTSNSIFVLFQGPWIIDQPDLNVLRATTVGHLEAPWSSIHHCPVGLGNICSSSLDNFTDSTRGNHMALPLDLGPGEQWPITQSVSYIPPPGSITQLFDGPYAADPFVYIKGSNMTVMQQSDDRTVTLPMPDAAYVGGYLNSCTVSGSTIAPSGSAQPTSNYPYTVVIFEYRTKSGNAPALTLNPGGRPPILLSGGTPNTHLVFRMIHSDQMTDRQHVHAAHESLRRRIRNWAGDSAMLDLTLSIDPKAVITSTPGKYTANFDPYEMGLAPSTSKAGTSYGDCCGGGIVLGS
jgi:hypothetical protein